MDNGDFVIFPNLPLSLWPTDWRLHSVLVFRCCTTTSWRNVICVTVNYAPRADYRVFARALQCPVANVTGPEWPKLTTNWNNPLEKLSWLGSLWDLGGLLPDLFTIITNRSLSLSFRCTIPKKKMKWWKQQFLLKVLFFITKLTFSFTTNLGYTELFVIALWSVLVVEHRFILIAIIC